MIHLRTAQLLSFLVFFAIAGFSVPAQAQVPYTLQAEQSRLWIDGTSNRDDWTVHANEIHGSGSLSSEGPVVSQVIVTIPSASVSSNSNRIMDRLISDALKVRQHDTITFELIEAAATGSGSNDAFSLTTKGRLTLAGVANEIDLSVNGERLDGGAVRFTGSTPLNMQDYDMSPPVAMFGALRTSADVTIHFDVVFAPGS